MRFRSACAERARSSALTFGLTLRTIAKDPHWQRALPPARRTQRGSIDDEARSTSFSVAMTFCSTIKPSPGLIHVAQAMHDVTDDDRRKTGRRLVEQQPLRPRHQRQPKRKHLLLASGHRACALGAPLVEHRKQMEDGGESPIQTANRRFKDLLNAQSREHIVPLRHEGDTLADRLGHIAFRKGFAVPTDRPAALGMRPDEAAQERRLARAVVPKMPTLVRSAIDSERSPITVSGPSRAGRSF